MREDLTEFLKGQGLICRQVIEMPDGTLMAHCHDSVGTQVAVKDIEATADIPVTSTASEYGPPAEPETSLDHVARASMGVQGALLICEGSACEIKISPEGQAQASYHSIHQTQEGFSLDAPLALPVVSYASLRGDPEAMMTRVRGAFQEIMTSRRNSYMEALTELDLRVKGFTRTYESFLNCTRLLQEEIKGTILRLSESDSPKPGAVKNILSRWDALCHLFNTESSSREACEALVVAEASVARSSARIEKIYSQLMFRQDSGALVSGNCPELAPVSD